MNHLTTKQALQFTDGTLDYASQAQCTSHLAVCEQCRREVEFQKSLAKIARRQPTIQPSGRFTENVMLKVNPRRRSSLATQLLDNLGNMFAMVVVLTVVGYAITNPSLFTSDGQSSEPSYISQQFSAIYAKAVQTFTLQANTATQKVVSTSTENGLKTVSLTLVSLLILVALDQFILKRFNSVKMKH